MALKNRLNRSMFDTVPQNEMELNRRLAEVLTQQFEYNEEVQAEIEDLKKTTNTVRKELVGEIFAFDVSASQTLGLIDVWVKVTGFDSRGDMVFCDSPADNDSIFVGEGGRFGVNLSLSFTGSAKIFGIAVCVNSVIVSKFAASRKLGSTGDIGSVTLSGSYFFSVGDEIAVFARGRELNSQTFVLEDANLSVRAYL